MNKKLLTAFLFGASVLASTSTFVSCKDYDDDIKAVNDKLSAEETARKALEEKVAAAQTAITALQGSVADLKKHEEDCDAKVAGQIADLDGAIKALQTAVKQNADDIVKANKAIDQALIDAKAYTDAAIALEDKKNAETYATIADVNNKISDVLSKYQALSDEIAAVKGEYGSLKAALDAQKAALEKAIKDGDDATLAAAKKAVEDAKKELEAHEADCDKKVDAAFVEIYKAFDAENGTIGGLKNAVTNMKVDITNLKNYAEELKTVKIPAIEADIKKVSDDLALMTQILSAQLRSLVFMPYLYVDGIEATRYRVLADTVLKKVKQKDIQRKRGEYEAEIGCNAGTADKGTADLYTLTNIYDYVEPTPAQVIFYGPTWPVDYHMNPTSAEVKFSEIKGFKVLAPEVITRAAVTADDIKKMNVTAEEFYQDGSKVFGIKNGELTVGIKVGNPSYLFDGDPNVVVNNNPELANKAPKEVGSYESGTGHWSYGRDNTVALQVYEDDYKQAKKELGDTITSDYAMLYGTKVLLEGIVWNSKVGIVGDENLEGKGHKSPYECTKGYSRQEDTDEWFYNATGRSGMKQDEAHTEVGAKYRCGKHIHVYDCPEEALFDKNPVMLYWNDKEGIKLEDYLALHWYEENVNRTGWNSVYETNFTDKTSDKNGAGNPWKQYGLTYDFEFCNYQFGSNKTSDSKYAYWKDNKDEMNSKDEKKEDGYFSPTGTIIAGSCKTSNEYATIGDDYGYRLVDQNKQSVHREPLVRVRVKKDNDVLLDGYILVHITDVVPAQKTAEVEFKNSIKFDLCNDAKALAVDWQDFTDEILAQLFASNPDYKDGISKTTFDEWFGGDETQPIFEGAADGDWANATVLPNGGYLYDCDLFANADPTAVANKDTYGRVEFRLNESGVANHEFIWYLTAEEMEQITHDKADNKGTVSVYIRWTGKAGAPYKYLWAKLTAEITREDVAKFKLAQKDVNYWYDYATGDHTGDNALSAVLLNVESPKDGGDTKLWNPSQLNNWLVNEVFLENAKDGKLVTTKCHGKDANVTTLDEDIAVSPLDGQTTKGHVSKGAKFYFVPEEFKVVVPANAHNANEVTYTITPYNGSTVSEVLPKFSNPTYTSDGSGYTNKDWNMLIPRYISHKLAASTSHFTGHDALTSTPALPTCKLDGTKHEWKSEENANKVINSCAIDYNAGCFNNDKLYAKLNNKYTLIATLDQASGVLTLIHYAEGTPEYNVVCDVLNAVGYDNESENHHKNNIAKELRTRIGVIAITKCDLAAQMQDATWMASWERPINVSDGEKEAIDAKTQANKIYLTDILNIYDWRGPVEGDMNKAENVWLWAYYNIHYITVDCTPSKVKTNLHYGNETWTVGKEQYMSQINPVYNRLFADSLNNRKATYNFDLHKISYERNFKCGHNSVWHDVNTASWSKCGKTNISFNYKTRSAELYDIFHSDPYTYVSKTGNTKPDGTPEMDDLKAHFGYIYYDNNMNNVERFYVIVPVTIGYEWGCFTTNVKVWIHPTLGN